MTTNDSFSNFGGQGKVEGKGKGVKAPETHFFYGRFSVLSRFFFWPEMSHSFLLSRLKGKVLVGTAATKQL